MKLDTTPAIVAPATAQSAPYLAPVLSAFKTKAYYEYLLLVAVTAVAVALRLYRLGDWSFWIDERFTINRVEAHYSSLVVVIQTIASSKWVPLSLVLTSPVLQRFGDNEWAARLVPALIGAVSPLVLYWPCRKLFGAATALLAALLLALSPWHLYWSQNARFYTSLMLLGALASFAFFYWLERDRPAYLAVFLGLLYLAASERLHALFILPGCLAYLLLLRLKLSVKPVRWPSRTLLVLAIPVLLYVIARWEVVHDVWATFGGIPNHGPLRLLASIVYRLGIAVVTLGLAAGLYRAMQRERAVIFVLLNAVVPVVLLMAAAPFMFTVDRYIFTVLPFWLLLTAIAIHQLLVHGAPMTRFLGAAVLVLVVGLFMSENVFYFGSQRGNRPDWRTAFQFVAKHKLDTDLVAATSPQVGSYYLGTDVLSINALEPDSAGDIRTWFLMDEATGGTEPAIHRWILQSSQLVEVVPVRLPGKSMDIRVYLYDPSAE